MGIRIAAERLPAEYTRLTGAWHLELPLLSAPLMVAGALVSLGSLGEFGAARFLTYGSEQTLPLVMFRLISRPGPENLGMAMMAASLFILVALGLVWLMFSATRARWEEAHR